MKYILCVGYQKTYTREICSILRADESLLVLREICSILRADESLLVLEEESLVCDDLKASGLKYFTGEYQQSHGAVDVIAKVRDSYDIQAVVPLREYAVSTAFRIAQSLGLGGVGEIASVCLRDKFLLRDELTSRNPKHFIQPKYRKVRCLLDLENFFDQYGPCVIKPSAQQSTIGVFVINQQSEIRRHYEASVSSDEPGRLVNDRDLNWEYHAE